MSEWINKMKLNNLFQSDTIDKFKMELEKTINILKDIHKEYPLFL